MTYSSLTELPVWLPEVLAHFLWQGTVLGIVVLLVLRGCSGTSARIRYAVGVVGLLLMAACVPVTAVFVAERSVTSVAVSVQTPDSLPSAIAVTTAEPNASSSGTPARRRVLNATPVEESRVDDSTYQPHGVSLSAAPSPSNAVEAASTSAWVRIAPLLTVSYFVGVFLCLLRLGLALWGGQRLRTVAQPIDGGLAKSIERLRQQVGLRTAPAVAWCERIAVPTVIGLVRPVVLLPVSCSTGLTAEQIEQILIHELAHIRRYDHWVNLGQRVIEAALFFHPLVWIVSRRIRLEREHCCDDIVLDAGIPAARYAGLLLDVAALGLQSRTQPVIEALHATAGANQLEIRIRRMILGTTSRNLRLGSVRNSFVVVAALAAIGGCLLIMSAATGDPDRDFAIDDDSGGADVSLVELQNGVRVKLLAVGIDDDDEWWAPDGTRFEGRPDFVNQSGITFADEGRSLAFLYRISGHPWDSRVALTVAGGKDSGSAFPTNRRLPQAVIARSSALFDSGRQTTTTGIKLTIEPPEALLTVNASGDVVHQDAELLKAERIRFLGLSTQGDKWVKFQFEGAFKDDRAVEILAYYGPGKGTMHQESHGQTAADAPVQRAALLRSSRDGLPLSEVQLRIIRYRRSIQFANVSLWPDARTKLEVTVSEPGDVTHAEFINGVAAHISRLGFATEWQAENAWKLCRQIAREQTPNDLSPARRLQILRGLETHVDHVRELTDPYTEDQKYLRRPAEVRQILWRLTQAIRRKSLTPEEQIVLDAQLETIRQWIRSVPLPPAKYTDLPSHDDVLSRINADCSDAMCPVFHEPLPESAFEKVMTDLREHPQGKMALVSARTWAQGEWMNAMFDRDPTLEQVPFSEPMTTRGNSGHWGLRYGYASTTAWMGNRNGISPWSACINLTRATPDIRAFEPPETVIAQGDAAVRQWFETSYGMGHIVFDDAKRRLLGVRGTQFIHLSEKSLIEVDGINAVKFLERFDAEGAGEIPLPTPVSVDVSGEEEFDALIGVRTRTGNAYVLKLINLGFNGDLLTFRIRPQQQHPVSAREKARRKTALVSCTFNRNDDIIWINAGTDDRVVPGARFQVMRTGPEWPGIPTGKAEIVRVLDRNLCEARIISQPEDVPVRRGDYVLLDELQESVTPE